MQRTSKMTNRDLLTAATTLPCQHEHFKRRAKEIAIIRGVATGICVILLVAVEMPAIAQSVIATVEVGRDPRGIATTTNGSEALVANFASGTVSIIDLINSPAVTATVALSPELEEVAVTPDGLRALVTKGSFVNPAVSVIDLSSLSVTATIPISFGIAPFGIAVTPDGTRALVANSGSLAAPTVSVIDLPFLSVVASLTMPGRPLDVVITPNGLEAWVTIFSQAAVAVIDLGSLSTVATVPVGISPRGIATTPDGQKVLVANEVTNDVSVVDVASRSVVATVPVGTRPFFVAVTPDGSKAIVTNQSGNSVSLIDMATLTVVATIGVGSEPVGVAITPDGSLALVSNRGSNTVSVIRLATVVAVQIDIKPGSFPNSINPRSRGTIPVAVLSSAGFDAPARVNDSSLTFGRAGDEVSLSFCNLSPEDVNFDGLLDQVCHFNTQQVGFQPGDTEGILKGQTVDAIPIEGRESVRIVP